MTRRNGGHPGAVPLDARSLEAIAMLQPTRTRWCDGCQEWHKNETYCAECSRIEGRPVYHLAE